MSKQVWGKMWLARDDASDKASACCYVLSEKPLTKQDNAHHGSFWSALNPRGPIPHSLLEICPAVLHRILPKQARLKPGGGPIEVEAAIRSARKQGKAK